MDAAENADGWRVPLRLHAAMLMGESGRDAALAFRVYDGTPGFVFSRAARRTA